jgi:hypothetical protein
MSKKVIVLDTETTNSIDDPLCYDIGWAVVDIATGEVVKAESFAVAEIFLDKDLMAEAYFADKIPSYWDEIKNGDRKLARLFTIRKALVADCKAYGVTEIYAHNARFDYLSCSLTQRYLTCSKYRYFFPYGTTICDTLKMSRKAFGSDEAYAEFCEVNGYKTANNQNRYTAEILYRFMSGDNDFEEVHKGIDDVLIEKDILLECLKRGVFEGKLWE